eukprot:TRINITY_DN6759_c0_g5_i2.p3 TRINITY_DN6759_c0_g5~~TRINITY_DN6759_c0_g5_i2.p3  ORF type:complete len:208 (-),score=14.98 TRINITY_DN6759_c0_g5_i2:2230-2826(-)
MATQVEQNQHSHTLYHHNKHANNTLTQRTPTIAYQETSMDDSRPFECNICLETARDPVVTFCGHLYCWPCLYKWMRTQQHYKTCPCCKAGIDVDKVVPIYTRGCVEEDPRKEALEYVPPRPLGQRTVAVQRGLGQGYGYGQGQGNTANVGVWQMLFGLGINTNSGTMSDFTPEQQHQAFLSRLLLMLGSFVILCLLFF